MIYKVEHAGRTNSSFGDYKYKIFEDGRLIAEYWHDYRGDDHGIKFVNGKEESGPLGRMVDFLEGGGPQPLVLSSKAIAYLNKVLHETA